MRSPAEFYLKYLVSDPTSGMNEIYTEASKLNIIPNGANEDLTRSIAYLEALKSDMLFPRNYSPLDTTHAPTRKFLKKEKIWGLWHPNMAVKEAVSLYEVPAHRATVCTGILASFAPSAIKDIFMRLHRVDVMEASLQEFYHYFWNLELLTKEELRLLVTKYDTDSFNPMYAAALAGAKNHIWGAHLTLFKLGLVPKDLDRAETLKTLYTIAYGNMLETTVLAQGRSKSEAFKNYATTMLQCDMRLSDIEEQTEDIISEFASRVRIAKREQETPTIHQIVSGEGPTSVEDIMEAEIEEIDNEQAN